MVLEKRCLIIKKSNLRIDLVYHEISFEAHPWLDPWNYCNPVRSENLKSIVSDTRCC